ncbi:MAG: hypothetical protein ABF504_07725, partial [Komagataeibacter saccharivorans]|uniref:hypothetical protein n=1 Tax=Komagataeibacter saccharivorans TaxID=265959 RepID=UPI0039EBE90F
NRAASISLPDTLIFSCQRPAGAASPSGEGAFTDISPPCQRSTKNAKKTGNSAIKQQFHSLSEPKNRKKNEK